MSRYCKWQQQTKNKEIGILTLFHLSEIHGQIDHRSMIDHVRSGKMQAPTLVKRIRKREQKWLSELESGLCNKIDTSGHQAQMANQSQRKNQNNRGIFSQLIQQKIHKSRLEHSRDIEKVQKGQKNRKISLKLQYYDVAHMSMVLNSRPIKNKLYSKIRTISEEDDKRTENNQRGSECLRNRNYELQTKINKKESYRQVCTKSLKELLVSSQEMSLSSKKISPQSFIQDKQRVINLERIKLRRQKYNFCEIFKKKFKISSERELTRLSEIAGSRLKTLQHDDSQKKPRFLKPLKNINVACVSSKLLDHKYPKQLRSHLSLGSNVQNE